MEKGTTANELNEWYCCELEQNESKTKDETYKMI